MLEFNEFEQQKRKIQWKKKKTERPKPFSHFLYLNRVPTKENSFGFRSVMQHWITIKLSRCVLCPAYHFASSCSISIVEIHQTEKEGKHFLIIDSFKVQITTKLTVRVENNRQQMTLNILLVQKFFQSSFDCAIPSIKFHAAFFSSMSIFFLAKLQRNVILNGRKTLRTFYIRRRTLEI